MLWFVDVEDLDAGWVRETFGPFVTREEAVEMRKGLLRDLRLIPPTITVKPDRSSADQVNVVLRKVVDG